MLVKSYGCALLGVDAITITIEVSTDKGFKFYLVGLPDNAVKESQRRIEAALKNVGLRMPGKRITINMAPADLRKEGSSFDLPIAMAILAASGNIEAQEIGSYVMMGELSLDGGLQSLNGALPAAIRAKKDGFKGMLLPEQNASEASVVEDFDVVAVRSLNDAIDFMENRGDHLICSIEEWDSKKSMNSAFTEKDFSDVKGQESIKRALEVAAAGNHNAILIGPPGAGKTMLARRMPGILPGMSLSEAIDTTKVHSVAGLTDARNALLRNRPFRNPHHTISDVALVGGGGNPQPGEISLAHNGILFLDELPEFKRSVLEVLRQPLEEGKIQVSRARMTVEFPAKFMMIASMNPCPCGNYNHPEKECICPPALVHRYLNKISGPLLDRIDLHIEVTPLPFSELSLEGKSESSAEVAQRVRKARNIQKKRFSGKRGQANSDLSASLLREHCKIENDGREMLKEAVERLNLSARAYDRILRVSRTIADLDDSEKIEIPHLAEAIQYRSLDRQKWAG